MVAVAVRKEDRQFSLSGAAPGAAARGEMAHPLRRLRLSLPAAQLGVVMNDFVVLIVSGFFIMGITVGIIAVIAYPFSRPTRSAVQAIQANPWRADLADPATSRGTAAGATPAPMATRAGRARSTTISSANSSVRGGSIHPRVPSRGRNAG